MQKNEIYFYKELDQYDLTENMFKDIEFSMREGVEIMTKKEITKCIEEHIDLMGWY